MNVFSDKVAVVTGASSGMGRSLAVELARRGAKLALCDINEAGLEETARLCEKFAPEVETAVINVAERESVLAWADSVAHHYGAVHYVFNNAGIGFIGTVERSEFKDIERVMDVDFWGVVNGTKAFLPHLLASGDGHVVNTSSILGLFSLPASNAYSAAKFAVRGFTESFRQEMLVTKQPIKVTCVYPGGIKTDFAHSTTSVGGEGLEAFSNGMDRLLTTSADSAAKTILKGVERGQPKILVGLDASVVDVLARILGSNYQRLVAKISGRLMPKAMLHS
ncbi:SDR family NAD(P)-dependent oxidoreductase [Mycolicibacterium llatzerense]|uniref:SDR family NAD(P)-dependent oxidoreductase n=1 Tax=Mycolicibacterium llatzerense TaxID=280871 RepID=UPI0021B541FD|nr:SDR family oxidoreductase [Mycolicibacterium llatzerense]MCT7365841.1 acetoin dehydrogenase [Mycolicibacterium llatzerense]